jgi:hypothetical protein
MLLLFYMFYIRLFAVFVMLISISLNLMYFILKAINLHDLDKKDLLNLSFLNGGLFQVGRVTRLGMLHVLEDC